jgi:hypothetical protein
VSVVCHDVHVGADCCSVDIASPACQEAALVAVEALAGSSMSHESLRLVWFDGPVPAVPTYLGRRRRLPHRNEAVTGGEVNGRLDRWLEEYPMRHDQSSIRPHGRVSSCGSEVPATTMSLLDIAEMRLPVEVLMWTVLGVGERNAHEAQRAG